MGWGRVRAMHSGRAPQLAALGHRQLARRGAGAGRVGAPARPQAHALQAGLQAALLAEERHRGAAGRRRRRTRRDRPRGDRQLRVVRQVAVLRAAHRLALTATCKRSAVPLTLHVPSRASPPPRAFCNCGRRRWRAHTDHRRAPGRSRRCGAGGRLHDCAGVGRCSSRRDSGAGRFRHASRATLLAAGSVCAGTPCTAPPGCTDSLPVAGTAALGERPAQARRAP